MVNPLFCNKFGGGNYQALKPTCINVERLRDIFLIQKGSSQYRQFYNYVNSGFPLQWGCLSDPFCNFEKRYGVGLEVMKILDEAQHPASFSTKGTWWLDDSRYMNLFKKNKDIWRVQFSFSANDDEVSKKLECGAPSTSERIEAMHHYYVETGKAATLRLRPFVIGITDKDEGHIKLIDRCAKEGNCFRVSTEFFCLESRFSPGVVERFNKMSELAGFNLIEYYRNYSIVKSGYLKLCRDVKKEYVQEMSDACKRNHLYFYVSDAMLKDRSRDFHDSNTPDGEWKAKMYGGQFSNAIQFAMKSSSGCVRWEDIKADVENCMSSFLWRQASS